VRGDVPRWRAISAFDFPLRTSFVTARSAAVSAASVADSTSRGHDITTYSSLPMRTLSMRRFLCGGTLERSWDAVRLLARASFFPVLLDDFERRRSGIRFTQL
jgi:hypothetical protein